MPGFVRARNKVTGAVASLPEDALPMFYDWEIDEGPAPDRAKPKRNLRRSAPDSEESAE